MIRTIFARPFALVVFGSLVLAGCNLQTEIVSPPSTTGAGHVVINELFTLPRSNPSSYSWLELYNPTPQAVNVGAWTLTFFTRRQVIVRDTAGVVRSFQDTEGVFDIPFGLGRLELPPNGFLTFVNNESRLLTFSEYGPGTGSKIDVGLNIVFPPDTVRLDSIRTVVYEFFFRPSDQIVLRDSLGKVVDVVRYGNYVYSGPDPYPGNHSAGLIPEYQSLARYAGAYSTGNTADDFYITGVQIPQTRPIPHYFSQARHP